MLNKLSIQTQQKLIEAIQIRIHEECTNIDSIDLIEYLEDLNESSILSIEIRQLLEILMNINDLDAWIEEILKETIFEVDPLLE